jgi:hypothetical protein
LIHSIRYIKKNKNKHTHNSFSIIIFSFFSFSFSFLSFFFFYIHNTKYNFKTNKQKNYNNSPKTNLEFTGNTFCKPEQCSAGYLGAGTVAARPPTRPSRWRRVKKFRAAVGSGAASSPLPFPAGGDNHHHLQKKKKRKQSFGSSSPFLDLLSFCSLFLPV